MYKSTRLIVGIVACLVFMSTAHATIWYVHPDSALNSIQAGIDSCSTGDSVLVGPGTYIENINFNGMAISVMSEYGPDTTIIDGSSPSNPDTGSVVCFVNGEDTTSVLYGFTITGGTGTVDPVWGRLGGGIICSNASPTIMGNIISADTADYGGGIECEYYSSPIITGNTIRGNRGDTASGGIECYRYSSPHIEGNAIDSNTSNSGGGGIQVYDNCSPNIINNSIIHNIAGTWGGGIRVGINSAPTIIGNLIEGNEAAEGGGIECDGNGSPIINGCTISGNLGDGIWCETGSNPVINDNNIFDNTPYGVRNTDPGITINAEDNWWGDATGPYHATNPGGLGDTVSDYVDFIPWRTVGIEEHEPIQQVTATLKIFPNPFSKLTRISFGTVRGVESAELKIYDATGRVVKEFNHLIHNQIYWNGTDDFNRQLPSGVYFLKFETEDYSVTEKLLLIK